MNRDDAIREAHRNYDEEEYFHARPQIDCNDRRRVFQAGFDRGWKAAREDVERFLKPEESIEECLTRNRQDIFRLMQMLADEKKKAERMQAAPSADAARLMGQRGGEIVEEERIAFEAWMKVHNWTIYANWDGEQYTSTSERASEGRYIDQEAIRIRMLWAAWRDRAALTRQACDHQSSGVLHDEYPA